MAGSIHPVFFDRQPRYLQGNESASLLFLPTAAGTLYDELRRALAPVTTTLPWVVPCFAASDAYLARMEPLCGPGRVVDGFDALRHAAALLDPADHLLLIDAHRYPQGGFDFAGLCEEHDGHDGYVRHLVSLPAPKAGARERAWVTPDGRLRRIQRYFSSQAWPFAAGVLCTLVPVTVLMALEGTRIETLAQLRGALATHGVPSRDLPETDDTYDLGGEDGALRLVEHAARGDRHAMVPRDVIRSHAARIAPSARLIGDVAIAGDVEIGEHAIIVGPAALGHGVRVGDRALVAQCLVLPDTHIPDAGVFRHRVVHGGMSPEAHHAGTATWRPYVSRQSEGAKPEPEAEHTAGTYIEVKRWIDAAIAGTALLLLSPVMLLVALAIKLTSPGSVFFGHTREGRNGTPFKCWKFRTMGVNADAAWQALRAAQQWDGPQFKMSSDPRVTPIGRILRATNLDELPQLLNVLCGQMSFVGPRPSPLRENQICVPWRRGRLSVRPGITGLWQVCRHDRENGDFHQWIEYDLLYVRYLSPLLDLRIFLATILTLGGKRPVRVTTILPSLARRDAVGSGVAT